MSFKRARLRRLVPGVTAIALLAGIFAVAQLPTASASEVKQIASQYHFTEMPIAMPPGYHPTQTIRQVNPGLQEHPGVDLVCGRWHRTGRRHRPRPG